MSSIRGAMWLPISEKSYRSHTVHHTFLNKVNAPETVADPNLALSRMQEVLGECDLIVQVAIFLSDAVGMGAVLEDNIKLMDAHLRKGTLKGVLPVVAVGNKLTVLEWQP
jgi:hypothetical protein